MTSVKFGPVLFFRGEKASDCVVVMECIQSFQSVEGKKWGSF